jgi:hypothetical protein
VSVVSIAGGPCLRGDSVTGGEQEEGREETEEEMEVPLKFL